MSNLKNIGNKLFKETTELKSHDVELGISQDLKSAVKSFQGTVKTGQKVIDSAKKVNIAIRKIESDAKFYNKYKKITYGDLSDNVKYIQGLMNKAESAAKELGIDEEGIEGFREAKNFVIDAKSILNNMNTFTLEFDV